MVDYQSLYRRYRPQRFGEVRGQDHVVNALRHAVRDNRVAHAYLFSGPRGTGKTSTARILAKALNCMSPVEGEPCGVCDSCVDITRGASFDVHELDAASNNGVDAMRDLVARASLATPGRWKVYIVDEVHMLSQAASNALLKTLEEPPDHVVFVLATTDPQKVLPTIRSRTQHYEFHLLDGEILASLLSDIAADARLELPDTAVEAAVRRARGSARDALSALDQVVASGVVEDDSPFLRELLVSLAERDTRRALQAVESALIAGRDAPRIAAELLDELRAQFLAAVAPDSSVASLPAPAHAHPVPVLLLGPARTVRAMEVLGAAMVAMRDSLDARITLEVALVRLTHPEADDDPAALLERIERLERKVQELAQSAPPPPAAAPPPPAAAPPPPAAAPPPPAAAPPPPVVSGAGAHAQPALGAFAQVPALGDSPRLGNPPAASAATTATPETAPAEISTAPPGPPPTRDEFVAAWGDHVLSQLRPRVRAVFAVGRFVGTEGATAILALPNSAHVERASSQCEEVAQALGHHFGRPVELRLVAESDVRGESAPPTFAGADRLVAPKAPDASTSRPAGNGQMPAVSDPGPAIERVEDSGPAVASTTASRVLPDGPRSGAPDLLRAVSAGHEPEELDDDMLDPDDLDPHGENVGGDPLSWAQDRLMEAFPGAEEV